MYSRRDLAKIALGALTGARLMAKPNSVIEDVILGLQSYSFRDLPLEEALKAMVRIGFSYCELWEQHIVPLGLSRTGLREWRETIAIERFAVVRDDFSKAGVKIYAYNYTFSDDFSDGEMDRGFEMAKELGAKAITSSSTVDMAERVNFYAAKHKMMVGMHNHDSMKPNEFSTPDDFAKAMENHPYIGVSLDVGHFVAAGFDPLSYIDQHMDQIVTLHLKDRKKDHGPDVPFGQGDTPLGDILRQLSRTRSKVPAMIECEYAGENAVEEVQSCYNFCKAQLKR
jgi:sugar phosphate isomerase/epimerase